ncbi:MAG: hypothetical protein V4721_12485 [Bacteroidota bacterium]
MNGITILKDGRYRKRYVGSKRFAVDINGELRTSTELKTLIESAKPKDPGKKRGRPSPLAAARDNAVEDAKAKEKSYSINKPEIRARIFAMIAAQKQDRKELYFWTVTFPMNTDDQTIYQLYNIWLTTLRQKKWLKEYLWVAERQQNGTLHFHLCIPHKLSVVAANRAMAGTLANASRKGLINYSIHQCKRYNGVDIAKNRKTKKVTNFGKGKQGKRALTYYITKYITKNNGIFSHLAWHNSRGFSQLFTGVTFTMDEFQAFGLVPFVRRYSAIRNEYFTFYPWLWDPPPRLLNELSKLNTFIQNLN